MSCIIIVLNDAISKFFMVDIMKFDEVSGLRGLKQIWDSLLERDVENKEEIFEIHASHYLNRCYPGWMKK